MTTRILWTLGGLWFALPLASVWAVADVSLALKLLPIALIALSAWRPAAGLGTLALLGPSAVPLHVAFGEPPFGRHDILEMLVLAVIAGIAWRWGARGPLAPGRLNRPALVLGAIVAASAITLLSVQQLATAPLPAFLASCWTHVTRDYFVHPRAFPAWHLAAVWTEALLLAVIIERVIRSTPGTATRLAAIAATGLAIEASFSTVRLVQVAGRSTDPIAALWHHWLTTRISPHYPDVNAMGSYFAMGAVVWMSRVLAPVATPVTRAASAGAAVVVLAALWLTGSRAALLATAAPGLVLWLGVRRSSRRTLLIVTAVAVAGGLLFTAAQRDPASRSPASTALFIRVELAKVGAHMTVDAPWFGVGLGEFRDQSTRYISPALVDVFSVTAGGENAHNQLIQVAAELGLVGLAALGWLLWAALGPAWRSLSTSVRADQSWAVGWTGGVCALLLSALLGHPWLTPFVLIFTFVGVGLVAGITAPGAAHATPYGPAPGRPARIATGVLLVLLAASLPMRMQAARAAAELDNRFIGASRAVAELDGVRYRVADDISTWFVRTTARIIEIPLRADEGGACEVAVDVDRRPANQIRVTDERWHPMRFTFHAPETRWNSRRIDVRVSAGTCRLLVGRFVVLD